MRVFISAIEYDLQGYVEIDALPVSEYGTLARRATRVATLDGGAVSQDFGFTHADRKLSVRFLSTNELDAALKYLVENYPLVQVSVDGGVFYAIAEYQPGAETSALNLDITESLI